MAESLIQNARIYSVHLIGATRFCGFGYRQEEVRLGIAFITDAKYSAADGTRNRVTSPGSGSLFPGSLAGRIGIRIPSRTFASFTFSFWRIRDYPGIEFLFTGPIALLAPSMPGTIAGYAFLFASHHKPLETIHWLQEPNRRMLNCYCFDYLALNTIAVISGQPCRKQFTIEREVVLVP